MLSHFARITALRYLLLLFIYIFPYQGFSSESIILVSNKIPEGFEDLAGPQTNQVDVYLHNKHLISTLATYDLETLQFQNPAAVVELIEDLIDPQVILKALSEPLKNNTELLCLQHVKNDTCGTLEPNIIGIIFDDSRFRVDIFINSLQLKAKTIEQTKFLPLADKKLSTFHMFNLNGSGTDSTEDRFNAQATSLVAYGDGRLHMQSNYTNNEDFVIDELSLQKDNQGWEAEAGIFDTDTNSSNFLPQQDILGFRVKTSTNTRTDLDVTSGTPIFIFLSQRSRVEVFKDSRLIDAQFYDAGNRQLDTSRFPDGAYQISVRIREENGRERAEEYFFVRSFALPQDQEPHYFVEAGKINEVEQDSTLPDTSDNHLIHAGVSVRLKENLALNAELANTNNQSMAQIGFIHIAAGMQTQADVMVTTENDWGVSLRENLATKNYTLNLDLRYLREGDSNLNTDDFDFVSNSFTQASTALTHELLGGRAFWRYRHIDQGNLPKSETYSFTYRRPLYRQGHYQFDWDFDLNKDSDDYLIGARVNFTYRKQKHIFRVNPEYQVSKQNNEQEESLLGDASWQYTTQDPKYGRLQSRVFHDQEDSFSATGINIRSESKFGLNQIELSNTNDSGEDIFGYSLRSQFGIASNFKSLSIGGSHYNTSAIIVDLTGEPEGDKFEVFIDRQSVGYAEVGEKTVFPLPPYQTYEVNIAPRSESFVTYRDNIRQVTLYPGNVNTLSWKINRVLIFIGQAKNPDGTPVKNARIENGRAFSGTDERGWFQVEMNKVDSLQLKKPDGNKCKIELGEYDATEDIHVFNTLICMPVVTKSDEFKITPERSSAQLH